MILERIFNEPSYYLDLLESNKDILRYHEEFKNLYNDNLSDIIIF